MHTHQRIINVTPHAIRFACGACTEGTFTVEPCGVVISATAVETVSHRHPSGAEVVRTSFVASEEAKAQVESIIASAPTEAVIVGSIITAQAFPGQVFAMTPAAGFERVPTEQKQMNPWKFTGF